LHIYEFKSYIQTDKIRSLIAIFTNLRKSRLPLSILGL